MLSNMNNLNVNDARHPTLCLNMIVKNESHVIRRTLEMLCSKLRFHYWVICDTGSTDDTREIIQAFFSQKHVNIEGELHCDEWVDFAHNRTLALNRAHGKTDLLLVFDADDELHGTITLPSAVTHDEYHLKFGVPDHGTSYTRTLLINNRKRFQYYSVVHEYISCLEPSAHEHLRICVLDGDYYVVSGRSGARNQDPDKYLKDAVLLEKAHAEALSQGDDLYKRYAFYCANSYRDCGRHEDAIRWYKVTLSQDNWAQEKYVSCLYIYNCYEALGQKEHGFFYLVKAFAYDLERVECLYPLVVHYCCDNANDVAYNYYRIVEKQFIRANNGNNGNNGNSGKLFLETDKANFFLPYYMIIVADRVGDRACGIRMYEIIFMRKQRTLSAWHLRNLMFNLRFFIGHVKPDALAAFAALANEYVRFLRENGVPLSTLDDVVKDFNYDAYGVQLLNHLKPNPMISSNFSRYECKNSQAILFYAGYSSAPWNHSSMLRGALGGSERAVAHLSKELCRQGYTVYVSGGVQQEEHDETDGVRGVKYVGLSDLPELLRTTPFHTIVCSRYISFLELYGSAASWHQFYVWAHDTHLLAYGCDLSDTAIIEKWSDHIDGCVCQTRWHADEYARQYPVLKSKIRVINNGIDPTLFSTAALGEKVRNRFIYTSRTERGLSRILELWPDIIAAMPDATLVISTYVAFPCNDDERRIQARIAQLNEMHPGQQEEDEQVQCIRHLGQLNPAQLYAEMGAAEYWLYPTDWPETSCITAMEMLMSGVICLYYPVAGLTDTMGGCGIQIAPGSELETLTNIVKHGDQGLRRQGRAYAEGCTWAHRAQQWSNALRLSEPSNQSKQNESILFFFPNWYNQLNLQDYIDGFRTIYKRVTQTSDPVHAIAAIDADPIAPPLSCVF
jgi:glycosyltransferase involved in cell wall biosynthesis